MGENVRWLPTPVSPLHTSWMKKYLQKYLKSRPDVEQAVHTDHAIHHLFCSRRLLIAAVFVMLALAVMGLLLFWNYQCVFVWRMCYEDQDLSSMLVSAGA